ncbi:MAG: hypothetical protein LBR70_03595 [Lactobacillaceae bacterium]|jgi:ABC-type multidrug transport system fused ATPase/permease subunit|nr:hypothetical protein [Lactobacillaceae bacterium]
MKIDIYNNHSFQNTIIELKKLIDTKKELLDKPENIELKTILEYVISIKTTFDRSNVFLVNSNDLNSIDVYIRNINAQLVAFNGTNLANVVLNILSNLSAINTIVARYPTKDEILLNSKFDDVIKTYKEDSERHQNDLKNELADFKNNYEEYFKDIEYNKVRVEELRENVKVMVEDVQSLVDDAKEFSAKYTTKEKAKHYEEIADVNEKKADIYLKYTNYAMFFALVLILLPIALTIFCSFAENISFLFVAPKEIDFSKLSIIPNNITFGGALLKISYTLVAFFPVLFFARLEQKYRDRAFKFKDLRNAILSINPYLGDINPDKNNHYDMKDNFRIEMAKIFFTQIHSTRKEGDKDILGKFEKIAKIIKDLR